MCYAFVVLCSLFFIHCVSLLVPFVMSSILVEFIQLFHSVFIVFPSCSSLPVVLSACVSVTLSLSLSASIKPSPAIQAAVATETEMPAQPALQKPPELVCLL